MGIDASGPVASVALVQDEKLLYEALLMKEKAHASHLAPMVQNALDTAGVCIKDCDALACVAGPGSFTGVRIGVALAQGIAFAADLPCIAVNALEALAWQYRMVDTVVCPILDARAGQVYGAAFVKGSRVLSDVACPLSEFLPMIRPLGDDYLFVGDGAGVHQKTIDETLGERATVDTQSVLRASSAAFLAQNPAMVALPAAALRPIYLRAPQAERERLAREHG